MTRDIADKQEIITTGNTESFWTDSVRPLLFSPLRKDISADVAIVGAGITGISAAYQLVNEGLDVVVVDDGAVGSGETGRTTAHISNVLDDRYYKIIEKHGKKKARLVYESHTEAVDTIELVCKREKIKCDFERVHGYLYPGPGYDSSELDKEIDACRNIGFGDVEMVGRAPVDAFNTGKALRFPGQAQFHSLKYIRGLAKAVIRKGGRIYTQTHVSDIKKDYLMTSDGRKIKAAHIVLATDIPIGSIAVSTKIKAYRTYVLGIRVPKGKFPRILLWDTGDKRKKESPYHYVRAHPHNSRNDILIIGNDDHAAGHDKGEESFRNLEAWARKKFPFVKKVGWKWSGHIVESIDHIGLIGKDDDYDGNVYVATGYSGMGMTHGTIASIIIRDQVLGRKNEWSDVYDPNRKNIKALKSFMKTRISDVKHLAKNITGGKSIPVDTIQRNDGAVVKDGVRKLAVYKDRKGKVHAYSAVCTHMGCLVRWNSVEKTFDCPCHGSRFSCRGKVITGPATKPLEHKDIDGNE